MEEITLLSATKIAELVRRRALSTVEVVEAYLQRIERLNPALNAIVSLSPDLTERARRMDRAVMRGESLGALHGVPVTIKDTFDVEGLPSTSGSRARAGRIPARDAPAVERLRAAGAIILGKTNVPEMALTYDCDNPVFGRTNNPHDLSRTPGGSSGGEAASIAARLSPLGLGSDLVGSIRIPAHFCGIFGLKPAAETVPAEGHCPEIVGRLKHAAAFGPLARSVEDLELAFDVLAGTHESSSSQPYEELRGMRVACYTDDGVTPVTQETARAVEQSALILSEAGFEVVWARPPGVEHGPRLWRERFSQDVAESIRSVYRRPEDEERAGGAVRALLARAANSSTKTEAELLLIDEECRALRQALIEWMDERPLLLAPVGAAAAFAHGARKVRVEDASINLFDAFSYAQTFNAFNLPAVCVPAGLTSEGLPLGVQIVSRPLSEKTLLRVARCLEEACAVREPAISASTKERNSL